MALFLSGCSTCVRTFTGTGVTVERGAQVAHGQDAIELEVTTYLGDDQIFVEGDVIYYLVSMNKDAYLMLILNDADGNLIKLYPNTAFGRAFHHAGRYIQVPDPVHEGTLVVSSPFGAETLWAFASTEPFPELNGEIQEAGLLILEEPIDVVREALYNHAVNVGSAYGEANVYMRTISGAH